MNAVIANIYNHLRTKVVYPITKAKAVYMDDNTLVEDRITEISDYGIRYEDGLEVEPTATNADTLEGHRADYFVSKEELEGEIEGINEDIASLNNSLSHYNSDIVISGWHMGLLPMGSQLTVMIPTSNENAGIASARVFNDNGIWVDILPLAGVLRMNGNLYLKFDINSVTQGLTAGKCYIVDLNGTLY